MLELSTLVLPFQKFVFVWIIWTVWHHEHKIVGLGKQEKKVINLDRLLEFSGLLWNDLYYVGETISTKGKREKKKNRS